MKLRSGMWRSVLVSALVIGSLAGVAVGTLTALGVTFGGGEAREAQDIATATASSPSDAPSVLIDSALRVSNRDRLAICVEAVDLDSAIEVAAETTVEAALPRLAQHPSWSRTDLHDLPPPIVDRDCPAEPALYARRPGQADSSNITTLFAVLPRVVTTASYYKTHVYILQTEEIERVSRRDGYRFTSEEALCRFDQCTTVTAGLYVTAEELADASGFTELLEKAVGLE